MLNSLRPTEEIINDLFWQFCLPLIVVAIVAAVGYKLLTTFSPRFVAWEAKNKAEDEKEFAALKIGFVAGHQAYSEALEQNDDKKS